MWWDSTDIHHIEMQKESRQIYCGSKNVQILNRNSNRKIWVSCSIWSMPFLAWGYLFPPQDEILSAQTYLLFDQLRLQDFGLTFWGYGKFKEKCRIYDTLHSMATANLNKSEKFVTNTTAASKYIPRRPRISINWNPPFQTSVHRISKVVFFKLNFFFRNKKSFSKEQLLFGF